MDTNTITDTLREVQAALAKLGQVLESAVRELKDKTEELRIVHDTNGRLTQENADLRKRGYELSDELAMARREVREANAGKALAEGDRDHVKQQLEAAQAECVKLREMILNVAVAIESAGLTPSKAMQAEVNKAKEDTSVRPTQPATPASEVAGSASGSASASGNSGAGEWSETETYPGQPRDPSSGQFRNYGWTPSKE